MFTGWYYQDISEFDTSRSYFFKALDHYSAARDYNKMADTYGNLGNAFIDIGDMKTALEYQMKSLQLNEQIILLTSDEDQMGHALRGRAYAWSNISSIYQTLGQYEQAIDFERKALDYEIEKGTDSIGMAISYQNIGTNYDDIGDLDSALWYVRKAHGIFKRHQFANGLVSSNLTLFRFERMKGDTVLQYLLDAHDITIEFEDRYSEVLVLGYLISGDFGFSKDSTDRMLKRAKFLMEEYDLKGSLYRFYQEEAIYKARVGDYRSAYAALAKYTDYFAKREIKNEQVDYRNAELRHEYQLQMLEDSLEFSSTLTEQKLDNEKRIGRQRIISTVTIFGCGILGVILVFVYRSLRVRKENNQRLSEKNSQIERQKELVEEKNKEITDSITYAKRLQSAILPSIEQINKSFTDAFVYYHPKDVVSGDFYWFEEKENIIFVAAADCTGHGVPGAMVSVVCSNALNRTVNEFGITEPAEILNKTRELVIRTFAKSGDSVKDGMDISLCAINGKKILFAGANNPLWIIRNSNELTEEQKNAKSTYLGDSRSLIELAGNKQPVGLYENMSDFSQTEFELKEGDLLYLFTDGYADQFGGEKGKKLKYRNLKQLLLKHEALSFDDQHKQLEDFMNDWMDGFEQVDDICIIGIRV